MVVVGSGGGGGSAGQENSNPHTHSDLPPSTYRRGTQDLNCKYLTGVFESLSHLQIMTKQVDALNAPARPPHPHAHYTLTHTCT